MIWMLISWYLRFVPASHAMSHVKRYWNVAIHVRLVSVLMAYENCCGV